MAMMAETLDWVGRNKDWLFSGAFFVIIGHIAAIVVLIHRRRKKRHKRNVNTAIRIATDEEIKTYDPKIAKITENFKKRRNYR